MIKEELIEQRDSLLAELRKMLDALEYVDINAPSLVGYGLRQKRIASAKVLIQSIEENLQ